MHTCMYIHNNVYITTFYFVLQSEKFRQASKVTTKLASLASEATKCKFTRRYELLEQLADAWERDKKVIIVIGPGKRGLIYMQNLT